jgi:molecular chaperone HscB
MKLDSDDFELFGLPRRFAQDTEQLAQRWRELQAKVHPDRFATEGAAGQRVAMQWAVRVNEAYQRLKDPVKRAAYLCELQGQPVDAERNTAMPVNFLTRQMAWREALEDARSPAEVETLADEVAGSRRESIDLLQRLLDEQGNFPEAARQIRALMFIERFSHDVERQIDTFES